jgi:hypothetical protein
MQETGYLWTVMVERRLDVPYILERCVGDTFDTPNRSASPKRVMSDN